MPANNSRGKRPESKRLLCIWVLMTLSFLTDAGSSLELGDIEEINKKLCIVCPKHKYKITLAEGEGLYKATNPAEKVPTPQWYSKGIKQRVHKVTEVDEDIFVTLSTCPGWVESDYYQSEKGRAELRKAQESKDGEEDVNADEDV